MKCGRHLKAEAETECIGCRKPLCSHCETVLAKYSYCPDCANALVEEVIELIVTRWQIERERRKHPRLHSVISVDIEGVDPPLLTQGILVDLSVGGMAVITHNRLREQSTVSLTFTLPNTPTHLTLQGGVLRTKPVGRKYFFSGIMFMNLGNTQRILDRYIRQGSLRQYARIDRKVSFL